MVILGVDQTGALDSNKRPRPLPCALIYLRNNSWQLLTKDSGENPLSLSCFDSTHITELVSKYLVTSKSENYYVIVDVVIGLPQEFLTLNNSVEEQLKDYMRKTVQVDAWGLEAGKEFFNRILIENSESCNPSKRQVELALGANSVFTPYPFQKNVQTGTFRVWKEMALSDFDDLSFGHFSKNKAKISVIEGYPTLAFKKLMGTKRSNPKEWPSDLEKFFPNIKKKTSDLNQDHLDALLLAIQAFDTLVIKKQSICPLNSLEGGILGANLDLELPTS